MINKKNKIFVAGHKGMVGSAVIRKLKKKGFSNIIFAEKKKLNLLKNKLINNIEEKKLHLNDTLIQKKLLEEKIDRWLEENLSIMVQKSIDTQIKEIIKKGIENY